MSDEPNYTSIPETARTGAEVGSEAASQYLHSHSTALKEESTHWIRNNPTLTVGIALAVGIVLGRMAVR